jgi:hypothetical protein
MAATHERKYWDDLALPNQGPNGAGISGMVPLRQITHVQESVETHIDSGVLVARVEVGWDFLIALAIGQARVFVGGRSSPELGAGQQTFEGQKSRAKQQY